MIPESKSTLNNSDRALRCLANAAVTVHDWVNIRRKFIDGQCFG
jgi:hypothetical protein